VTTIQVGPALQIIFLALVCLQTGWTAARYGFRWSGGDWVLFFDLAAIVSLTIQLLSRFVIAVPAQ
jgi:hypothetical protein